MYAFVNSVIEAILSETTSALDGAQRQLIAQLYVTVIQHLPGLQTMTWRGRRRWRSKWSTAWHAPS
jgi:hypothetical protein